MSSPSSTPPDPTTRDENVPLSPSSLEGGLSLTPTPLKETSLIPQRETNPLALAGVPTLQLEVEDPSRDTDMLPPATSLTIFDGDDSLDEGSLANETSLFSSGVRR